MTSVAVTLAEWAVGLEPGRDDLELGGELRLAHGHPDEGRHRVPPQHRPEE